MVLAPQALALGPFPLAGPFGSTAPTPTVVATGDFNGDGRGDVASGGVFAGSIAVALQVPSGAFSQTVTLFPASPVRGMVAKDLDGDGALDLAVAEDNRQFQIFWGTGFGFFPGVSTWSGLPGVPMAITTGDFDGDGNPEIALGEDSPSRAHIFRVTPGRVIIDAETTADVGNGVTAIAAGNFNGDGYDDLALTANGGTFILDSFGPLNHPGGPVLFGGNLPFGIVATDLDGDGRTDLAQVNNFSSDVSVFRGNGNGGFSYFSGFPVSSAPVAIGAGDLDHDQRPDLVVAQFAPGRVSFHRNLNGLTYDGPGVAQQFAVSNPRAVSVSDLTGDGLADVVVGDQNGPGFMTWFGTRSAGAAAQLTQHAGINYGGTIATTSANFAFTSDVLPATYTCQLDTNTTPFPCQSPYTWQNLTNGAHNFYVTAYDLNGTSAFTTGFLFTVDTTPPDTQLGAGPLFGNMTSGSRFVTTSFGFSGPDPATTMQCSLDGNPYTGCAAVVTYLLQPGAHQIRARAVNSAGLIDQTPAVLNFFLPALQPSGNLVFESDRSGGFGRKIYLGRPDGTGFRALAVTPASDTSPAVSPDGGTIAFVSGRSAPFSQIFLMNPDGSNVRQFSHNFLPVSPAWSPDGQTIAFAAGAPFPVPPLNISDSSHGIYVAPASGIGTATYLGSSHPQTLVRDVDPQFSRDGRFIVFTETNADGPNTIWRMNAGGGGLVQLRTTESSSPVYSPSNSKILFVAPVAGVQQLWTMNLDGTGASQLTNAPSSITHPRYSPDGNKIVYSRGNLLYVAKIDGTNETLVAPGGLDSAPDWSVALPSPDVTIASPTEGQHVSGVVRVRATVADPTGTSLSTRVDIKPADSLVWTQVADGTGPSVNSLWDTTGLTETGYDVRVSATNGLGTESSATVRVTVDQLSNLVLDAETDLSSLDPAYQQDTLSFQVGRQTQAGLMALPSSNSVTRANAPVPELASGMPEISQDGTKYAFHLSDAYHWSNGYPVNAYDVERAFQRAAHGTQYVQSLMRDLVGWDEYSNNNADSISGIDVPGPYEIVFTLTKPHGDFLHRLTLPAFAPVGSDAPPPGAEATSFLDSSGPYVISSYLPAVGPNPPQLVLTRNPQYPGTRGRTFDHITIRLRVPAAIAVAEVRDGLADTYVGKLPAGKAAELRASFGAGTSPQRLFTYKSPLTYSAVLNTSRTVFEDSRIRQALGYVLDRKGLAEATGLDGDATSVTDHLIPDAVPGSRPDDLFTNDLAHAQALVADAGGPPAAAAQIYTCNNNVQCAQRAQIIQHALGQLGIESTIHAFPNAELFQRLGTAGEPYDISTFGWGFDWPDASNVFQLVDGRSIRDLDNIDYSYLHDPAIEQRIDDANAITDPVERANAWALLDEIVTHDYAAMLPYGTGLTHDFFSARIGCQINSWVGIDLGTLCDRNHPSEPSGLEASLQTDATVGASGATVPVDSIPLRIFESPDPNGPPPLPLNGLPLNALPLNGLPLNAMPLNALAQKGLPLNAMPLNALPLNGLAVDGTPLNGLPLNGLPLNGLPLNLPGGWTALLANTPLAGVPLQSVTLLDVFNLPQPRPAAIDALTLGDLDLANSALGRVTLGALALGSTPLNALPLNGLPLNALDDWCTHAEIVVDAPIVNLPGNPVLPPAKTPCTSALMGETSLFVLALNGAPLNGLPLNAMPLNALPLNGLPLNGLPLNGLDTSASPLNGLPLNGLMPAGSPLNGLPLNALLAARTPAPENAPTPLGEIRLAALTDPAAVVDCSLVACASGTLADALAAGALVPGATLGSIASSLGVLTLGDLHVYGTLTIGDLVHILPGTTLFGDVMSLLIKRSDVAWESLSPRLLSALDTSRPQLGLTAGFVLGGAGVGAAEVSVSLPDGFDYVPGSSSLSDEGAAATEIGDPVVTGHDLTWTLPGATYGDHYEIHFAAYSGTTAGAAEATETVRAGGFARSSTGSFTVGDTFEPNDNGGDVAELPEFAPDHSVHMSYIGSGGDVDFYRVPLAPAGDRMHFHLTNLSADFDLALFTTQASSVKTGTGQAAVPLQDATIADTAINLSGAANGQLAPTALQDVPNPGLPLAQVSANRNADDEDVGMVSPGGSGYAVLAVYGYQGATSAQPYTLRITTSQTPSFQCAPRSFTHSGTPGVVPAIASLPTDLNTLFLVDQKRIGDTYGLGVGSPATAADYGQSNVTAALNRLAGRRDLGVSGAVVPVEGLAQAQYDAWDSNPCNVAAANTVANLIANEISAVQAARPTLKYVVFVGGGDQIPFFSVPDLTRIANETGWASNFSRNQYFASAASSDLLTDDPYLDTRPISADGRQLFVPSLIGGRLGEKPSQIVAAIERFESSNGTLDASTGFVSGYDFIKDGAHRVADNLQHGFGGAAPSTLINDTWSKSDLLAQAFPAGGSPADINTWNGHYDNANALAANGDHSQLITTADLDAKGAHAMAGGIFFTMGCHAGFQTSDAIVGSNAPDARDWAETFGDHGTSFVGNTGFGLGNTDSVAFSEELMAKLAENLDGSMTIGEALVNAKASYFLDRTAFSSYDEKTLGEAELYGLPMYGVGVSPAPLTASPLRPQLAILSTTPSPDPVRGATTSSSPSESALATLEGTAAQVAPFDVRPHFESAGGTPTPRSGDHGQYFTNDGQVQAPNYRPLQPFVTLPASRDGEVAHGVLIDALSSHDIANFNPNNVRPTVDLSANEPEPQFTEQAWPTKVPTLVSLERDDGLTQNLNLTTGQFFTDAATNEGIQRLWTHVAGRVTYSSSDDFTPPSIDVVDAFVAGGAVAFTGRFSDLLETGDPGTVALAQVVYDVDNHGNWQALPLQVDPANGAWSAGAAFAGTHVQYFVEACDLSGNCGFSSNKGRYFDAIPVPQPTGTISITPDQPANANGWHTSAVVVSASSSAAANVLVSVDGGPFLESPATVVGDGSHTIEARGSDASSARSVFLVDTTKPEIDLQLQQTMRRGDEVHAHYTCTDRGSGISTCSGTTVDDGLVDTSQGGTFEYVVNATDIAGNTNQTIVEYTVIAGPTMPGAPTADKPVNNGSFALSWTPATEHNATITYAIERAPSAFLGPWTSVRTLIPDPSVTLTGEPQGTWVYRVIASDGVVQSDPSAASGAVLVDATPPAIVITSCPSVVDRGDAATLTFTALDTGGSGLATPSSGTIVLNTSATGSQSRAVTSSDLAGNSATVSCNYRVNTPPLPTSAPVASRSPNTGVFTISWASPPEPDNDPLTFTVLHAPSPGGQYSPVSPPITATTFAFTVGAPEAAGRWTYQVAVSDGHDTVYSSPSTQVIVDLAPPVLTLPTVIAANATSAAGAVVTFAPTATDAVDGPTPVTCGPPSGTTFGIGDTFVSCAATDRAGNTATGSFIVRVAHYRSQISLLQAQITAAAATASASTATRLRAVAARLADADSAAYWVDSLRLQPPRGGLVFLDLELAADLLRLARGGSVSTVTLDGWTASIWRIGDQLARTAVTDAVAARGIAAKITAAQAALTSAQTAAAAGNYYAAIVFDAAAWVLAEQAMRKLP
jgi:ABC-type oligopeptide transport system substrate-binding subunit/Tol biopolymer transport system component